MGTQMAEKTWVMESTYIAVILIWPTAQEVCI